MKEVEEGTMLVLEGNRTGSEHSPGKGPRVGLFLGHLRCNQGKVRWPKRGEWGTSWGGEGGEFAECGYTGSLGSNRGQAFFRGSRKIYHSK